MNYRALKARHLGIVTGGLLGCLSNANDSAGQPLSQTKIVAQP